MSPSIKVNVNPYETYPFDTLWELSPATIHASTPRETAGDTPLRRLQIHLMFRQMPASRDRELRLQSHSNLLLPQVSPTNKGSGSLFFSTTLERLDLIRNSVQVPMDAYIVRLQSIMGMAYAVKVISKSSSSREKTPRLDPQRREHQLHLAVSEHPNIVSIYATTQITGISALLMELCEEGDLFQNIAEFSLYENKNDNARSVFLQLLDAVEYCHSKGVFHRDLKPENVLVARNGTQVRLADFGLATMNAISYDYGWGSTFYMSPECIGTGKSPAGYFCAPGDVWALGVILVNLMCGRNPWKEATVSDSRYCSFRQDPNFIRSILPVTDTFTKILARVFEEDPIQRITLGELRSEVSRCKFFTKTAEEAALVANLPVGCPSPGPFYSSPLSDAYSDDTDASSVGEIDEALDSKYQVRLSEVSMSVFLPPIVETPVQQIPYSKPFDYTAQTRSDLLMGGDAEYWQEHIAYSEYQVDKPAPMSSPFAISSDEHMSPLMGSGYPVYPLSPFATPPFLPSTPACNSFSAGINLPYFPHGVLNPNIAFGFNP